MTVKPFLICQLILGLSGLSLIQTFAANPSNDLRGIAQYAVQEHRVAGAVIARIENARVKEIFSINNSDLKDTGVTKESVFQVGSISKPVAAWAVMTLVRDGKVELDDSVWKHVSRWQVPGSKFQKDGITVRRLLSHSAGLSLGGYPGFKESEELPSIEASLSGDTNRAGDVHQFQAPGAGFKYSGGGYTLLQLLIEQVSAMAFYDYVEQAVLSPLGMQNSSYLPSEAVRAKRSQAYRVVDEPIPQFHFRARAAAGLHSTADDLAKFIIANISDNPVLPNNLIQQMHTGVVDAGFAEAGLGFFISKDSGLIGHGGSNFGWRADVVFEKDTNSGLVILTNSERGERLIPEVRCAWVERYLASEKSDSCRAMLQARHDRSKLIARIGIVLLLASAIALAFSAWLGVTKPEKFKLLDPASRKNLLISLIVVLIIIAALAHTPLGAYLFSGFWSVFSTLHYAPMGSEHILFGIYALLLSLAVLAFIAPTR